MPLALEDKMQIVEDTRASASSAVSALVTDYRGMTVDEFTGMRKLARQSGVELRVIRNTLARRAFEGTEHDCLRDSFKGPTMLAFSVDDPGAGARLIKEMKKSVRHLDVRAISVAGKFCGGEELDKIASLPTKDQAIAQLMSVMLAPIAKLAQTMQAVPSKLVRTLAAVKEKKESED